MPDLNRDHAADQPHHDPRELTYRDLERLDAEQALTHQSERLAAGRHARFPKDDRRSSAKVTERALDQWLTERERGERWPSG